MKFSISKSALLPKLAQLAKVADGKVIPMLGDILFEAYDKTLTMTAGDGVISMSCTIDDLTITKTGAATVPAKKLHDIMKKMGDTIDIEAISTLGAKVKSGKSEYKLAGQDPIMYPKQRASEGNPLVIMGKDLKDMIQRTVYAVSDNEKQGILTGIKFTVKASRMTAVGCDKHRLSEVAHDLKTGFTDVLAVLKGDAMKDFAGILPDGEVKITFNEANVYFRTGDYDVILRVFDGSYPPTDKLVPTSFKTSIDVDVREFKDALERALVVALDDKTNVLRMDVKEKEILITANTETDKASEELEVKVLGAPITVSFNGKYMIDAMNHVDCGTARLCFNTVMEPIVIRGSRETDYQIVLPYRTR